MTREEFESYCPSAVMPDDSVYDRLSEYFTIGEAYVQRIIGDAVKASLATEPELETACGRVTALWAYYTAIPHLDLVLTENGFGVVSNQNVSPASSLRVNTLRQQVKQSLEDAIDNLLSDLRGNPDWVDTPFAIDTFRSIVWNANRQLMYFALPDGHRSDMEALRPKIAAAEERLKHCISPEFHKELCDAMRLDTVTPMQRTTIHYALQTLAADVTDDKRMARAHVGKLVEWLDSNIKSFPTYANSTAYAANTFEPYRNEKEDTCYFFG